MMKLILEKRAPPKLDSPISLSSVNNRSISQALLSWQTNPMFMLSPAVKRAQ